MIIWVIGSGKTRVIALRTHIYSIWTFLRIILLCLGTNFKTRNTIKWLGIISARTWNFIIKQRLRWLRLSESFIHLDVFRCSIIQTYNFILPRPNIGILTRGWSRWLWELIACIIWFSSSLKNVFKISARTRIIFRNINKAFTLCLPSTILRTLLRSVVLFEWTF